MAIIYDTSGNPLRTIAAQGGDALIDARPAAVLAGVNAETIIAIAQETSAVIDVRGSFTATMIAEISFDGTNYQQYPIFNPVTELYVVSITVAGQFTLDIPSGAKKVRVRMTAYTSPATVTLRASHAKQFIYIKDIPSSMSTLTATVGLGVTLTIPGASGLYNYLTMLQIVKFNAATLTAAATPVLVTTTNIIGNPVFSFPADAAAQGTINEQLFKFQKPIKGNSASATMVITCPPTTNVIWRVNAAYYIGA